MKPRKFKLGEFLSGMEHPSLSEGKKLAMRNHLLSQVVNEEEFSVSSVTTILNDVRNKSEVKLSPMKKAMIKERIMETIALSTRKTFSWSALFTQRAVSMALVFVMVFGLFSYWNIDSNDVVFADSFTVLDSFSGEISVERDGAFLDVEWGMELFESDVLVTGAHSDAVIEYFDDSVSRMGSDTEVELTRLYFLDEFQTNVELSLVKGKVWSKVVNLVEIDSSFIVLADEVEASTRKGAFNVKIVNDEVEVEVFKNSVEVKNGEKKTDKLVSGYKAVVEKDKVAVKKITEKEKKVAWITENLEDDIEHAKEVEEKLIVERKESVESSLNDKTLLSLTFDAVERKKIELDLAEQNFIKAELGLREEGITEIQKEVFEEALAEFGDEVADFYQLVDEVKLKDEKFADELDDFVANKILSQKKGLSFILPDNPAYKAKETIDDLELINADSDSELQEVKVEQALVKLAEAEDYIEKGNIKAASKVFKEGESDFSEIIEDGEEHEVESDLRENAVKVQDYLEILEDVTETIESDREDVIEVMANTIEDAVEFVEPVIKSEGLEGLILDDVMESVVDVVKDGVQNGGDSSSNVNEGSIKGAVTTPALIEGSFGVQIFGDKPLPLDLY